MGLTRFRAGVMLVSCCLIVSLVVGCFYCCVSCIVWIVCDVVLLSCFGEIANMLLSHFSGDF